MSHKKNSDPRILLAFDFGMKRIGVAIGQTITKNARPLDSLQAKEGKPNPEVIARLMKKWQPDALVVGVPLNMDGTEQWITHHAREFAAFLADNFNLPVYEMDERLTTKDARERVFQSGGYKALHDGSVDRVAAQLILENWFALQPPQKHR